MNIIATIMETKAMSKETNDYIDGYVIVETDGTAYGRIGNTCFKNVLVDETEIADVLRKKGQKYYDGSNAYDFAFYNGERVAEFDNIDEDDDICEIKFGCPWGKAPCGRDKTEKEKWGCEGCPAFDQETFKEIMDADFEKETQRAKIMKEYKNSFLPKNVFGSVDDI